MMKTTTKGTAKRAIDVVSLAVARDRWASGAVNRVTVNQTQDGEWLMLMHDQNGRAWSTESTRAPGVARTYAKVDAALHAAEAIAGSKAEIVLEFKGRTR